MDYSPSLSLVRIVSLLPSSDPTYLHLTGLPGGVGSIFISRISTLLHASSPQSLPGLNTKLSNPVVTSVAELEERVPLRSSSDLEPDLEEQESQNANQPHGHVHFHASSEVTETDGLSMRLDREPEPERLFLFAGTLFTITFPVQILFLLFVHYSGWVQLSWTFVIVFMIMFSAAVSIPLCLFCFSILFLHPTSSPLCVVHCEYGQSSAFPWRLVLPISIGSSQGQIVAAHSIFRTCQGSSFNCKDWRCTCSHGTI
jgi:hypothetical protein